MSLADPIKCEELTQKLVKDEKLTSCQEGVVRQAYQQGWEDCWADLLATKAAIAQKKTEPKVP